MIGFTDDINCGMDLFPMISALLFLAVGISRLGICDVNDLRMKSVARMALS